MADIEIELTTYPGLDDRIVIVRAGDEVDGAFVQTERFNVMIDTLATPRLCKRAIELLGSRMRDRPLLVVNSHMDWDHFWGNAALAPDVPVIAHSEALERLNNGSARQTLSDMQADDPRFSGIEIVTPSLTFSGDKMAIHGGDLTLELLHTPGHTPDHVAVWIPELRVCLAVDAVENPIPEVWSRSPGDLLALCNSLKRIRGLQADFVIPAHGQVADPLLVDRNLAYFAGLQDAVAELPLEVLSDPALSDGPGLGIEDFLALPNNMPAQTRAFYRGVHHSNLGAAAAARAAGIAFI